MPNQKSIWLTSAPKKCIIVMKKSSAVNLKNQECQPLKPLRLKRLIRVWRSLVSRLNGVQEALSSNLSTRTNKRTSALQMSFYFGFRRSKGGSTLRTFNARDSRTAPLPLAIVWAALVLFRAICRSTCSPPAGGQPQGLEMPLGPFLS